MAGRARGAGGGRASAAAAVGCGGCAALLAACMLLAAVAAGRFIADADNARAIGLVREPERWIVELAPAGLGTRLIAEPLAAVVAASCLPDGTVVVGGSGRLSVARLIADAFAAAGREEELRRRMAAYLGERVFVVLPGGQVRKLQPPADEGLSIHALAARPRGSPVAVGGAISVEGDEGPEEVAVFVAVEGDGWRRVDGVEGWRVRKLVWAGETLFAVVQAARRGQVHRVYAWRGGELRQVGQLRCKAIIWAGPGPRGLVLLVRRDGRFEWVEAQANGRVRIGPAREGRVSPAGAVACRIGRWLALLGPRRRVIQKLWKPRAEGCCLLHVSGPAGRWIFAQLSVKGRSDWVIAYDMERRGLVRAAKLERRKWRLWGMRGASRLVLSSWQEGTLDEPLGRCEVWDVRIDLDVLKRQPAARTLGELGLLPTRPSGRSGGT